ncbi:hypothetical protein KQX54_006461 [Cotesia glomerata]|uniref:Uncharacterized protein n=1 Tax=Cotesia glomerata TaxID=32391 RepID=A0AAV7IIZ6_COTGL|nr:hypothetical protein KQX54_006461 [Cotesia glomerata]
MMWLHKGTDGLPQGTYQLPPPLSPTTNTTSAPFNVIYALCSEESLRNLDELLTIFIYQPKLKTQTKFSSERYDDKHEKRSRKRFSPTWRNKIPLMVLHASLALAKFTKFETDFAACLTQL